MNRKQPIEKLKFFILGVLLTISMLLLTGASGESHGRYQVSAWSSTGTGFGAFIVDTATGETKIAYLNTGTMKQNNLGKPFGQFTSYRPMESSN